MKLILLISFVLLVVVYVTAADNKKSQCIKQKCDPIRNQIEQSQTKFKSCSKDCLPKSGNNDKKPRQVMMKIKDQDQSNNSTDPKSKPHRPHRPHRHHHHGSPDNNNGKNKTESRIHITKDVSSNSGEEKKDSRFRLPRFRRSVSGIDHEEKKDSRFKFPRLPFHISSVDNKNIGLSDVIKCREEKGCGPNDLLKMLQLRIDHTACVIKCFMA